MVGNDAVAKIDYLGMIAAFPILPLTPAGGRLEDLFESLFFDRMAVCICEVVVACEAASEGSYLRKVGLCCKEKIKRATGVGAVGYNPLGAGLPGIGDIAELNATVEARKESEARAERKIWCGLCKKRWVSDSCNCVAISSRLYRHAAREGYLTDYLQLLADEMRDEADWRRRDDDLKNQRGRID
ncbi:hypothetical protein N9C66_10840 [Akkermansiaceae bacterium]|nr:hypothetical protein [Akkermansiaceae bacterium]MDB4383406.1 hypothetical protein [Akkermansiaceae bacterium]MDB4383428.1 hypothetical protein [Akkermansiaceae bacterium]